MPLPRPGSLPRHFAGFRNFHAGQTIIVCGCGSSLKELDSPERFLTIGVNDVGRLFDPTYLVVLNPRHQFHGDRFRYVESSKAEALFTQLSLGLAHPNVVRIKLGQRGGADLSDPLALPYTQNSPYVALCLAAHMGAKRIGLIGVDFTDHHFFAQTGRHALANRFDEIDREYHALARQLERLGIQVLNLSQHSRLTAFPKGTVTDLVGERADLGTPAAISQAQRVYFVNYRFLSCGDVFKQGLRHAALNLGIPHEDADWDDPKLREKIAAFDPNLVFVVHGRKFAQRFGGLFPPRKTAVWLLDEPYEVDDTAKWSHHFDYVFINDRSSLRRHPKAHYLPAAFDPYVHRETDAVKKYDVGFVGGYNPARESLLLALLDAGLLSYVVGGPWRSARLKAVSLGANIPAEETAKLYQQTRIVVNVFRTVHHFNRQAIPAASLNPRIYEGLAAGALVVTEHRAELDETFPELPRFETAGQLVSLVGQLLGDPKSREEIRRVCASRLFAHRYEQRLQRVLEITTGRRRPDDSPESGMSRSPGCGLSTEIGEEMTQNQSQGQEPVDIVMLTYKRLAYLQKTIESLFERTTYPFRLTVVDNKSDHDVRHYLEANRDKFFQLILNETNEYVPAFHRGIAETTSDIFIATEPDLVVPDLTPCWLTQYLEIFAENPKLGLMGMRLDPQDKSPLTPDWAGGTDSAPVYNQRVLLGNVGVWLMGIRRKAYPGAFPSDCDVCASVRRKGYVVGYTRNIVARHLGWHEYKDYPEYLLEKSRRPHACFPHYAEAQLVDQERLKKKFTLIVTTCDGRLPWLKELLESLRAYTPGPFETLVVDNGTTDGTQDYLRTLEWVTTIRNERNLDDTRGVNQGLEIAKTDYIVKLDTDTLIAGPGWWEHAYDYMERHPRVGIAGDVWNPRFDLQSRRYKNGWSPRGHGIERLNHVQGGFMVLRKRMLDEIGTFNEEFPHAGMDVEISYRALSFGWELGPLDFVKSHIHEPGLSDQIKIYHPAKSAELRKAITERLRKENPIGSHETGEDIPLTLANSCVEMLKPGGICRVSSDGILISGQGWDNCLISLRAFENLVFRVGIRDLRGSVILKVRLQDQADPASNSYHVILGEWGNYLAKACHVFQRFSRPRHGLIQVQIAVNGPQLEVYLGGRLEARVTDPELKTGYVSFGIKDGSARFIDPRIHVLESAAQRIAVSSENASERQSVIAG